MRAMDISGKALREVEFRDDCGAMTPIEVDEFLEQVAIGVDELHARLLAQLSASLVPSARPKNSRSLMTTAFAARWCSRSAPRTSRSKRPKARQIDCSKTRARQLNNYLQRRASSPSASAVRPNRRCRC